MGIKIQCNVLVLAVVLISVKFILKTETQEAHIK